MAGAAGTFEATLLEATAFGVIPVVEVDSVADADPLAEALLEAGLGVAAAAALLLLAVLARRWRWRGLAGAAVLGRVRPLPI